MLDAPLMLIAKQAFNFAVTQIFSGQHITSLNLAERPRYHLRSVISIRGRGLDTTVKPKQSLPSIWIGERPRW